VGVQLVNIGSGVSILMVTGPDEFKRVGGSSVGGFPWGRCDGLRPANPWLQLGGGTLWGLLSKMTHAKTFDGGQSAGTLPVGSGVLIAVV